MANRTTNTMEEDDLELKNAFEGPKRRNDDPNLVVDFVYRLRFAKGGVVWHSWVDPNRPESPPVEWPQYPKDERPMDIPEEIIGSSTDPEVLAVAEKAYADNKNPITPIRSKDDVPCGPPSRSRQVEIPDKIEDELIDSVHMPTYPGLYPGEGSQNGGWFRGYGDNGKDEY